MKVLLNIEVTIAASMLLFLGGCAQTAITPAGQPVTEQTNPIQEVARLESDIAKGKQNELHVMSPDGFAKAEKYFMKAKKSAEDGSEISDILENIAKGQGALKNAEEKSQVAKTILFEVIESRDKARSVGAANLGERYDDVEEDFIKLTGAIEDNNIRYTHKKAPKVNEAYLTLELLAIKASSIDKVRPVLKQAEEEKAPRYVPQAFLLARERLDKADRFITENRYAKQEILHEVREAMFMTQRAIILNNQSKKLEEAELEEIALLMEENLHQLTTQLSAEDVRNQPMNTQVENILESIVSLQKENHSLNEQIISQKKEFQEKSTVYDSDIAALNKRIDSLEGTSKTARKIKENLLAEQKSIEQKLIAERKFNKKYLEVQTFFKATEADVYKQKNQLVIRLKAIKFPVGTAVILSENYSLLSKVQRSIQIFDGPSTVVEGHTDSTGSDEINQVLSNQRADAVRNYLVANKTIPGDKIDSRGYGSSRPLASNATPEGRAINRRIDVIINPSLAAVP